MTSLIHKVLLSPARAPRVDYIYAPVLSYNSGTTTLTMTLDVLTAVGDVVYFYWTVGTVWGNTADSSYTITADDVVAGIASTTVSIATPGTYSLGAIQYRASSGVHSDASNTVSITVASALSFVGYNIASAAGATGGALSVSTQSLLGGTGGNVQPGDLVLVYYANTSQGDTAISVADTTGLTFTEQVELFGNNATSSDTNLALATAIAGATIATSITATLNTGVTNDNGMILRVWRGASASLDVAVTTATGVNNSIADGAAITPVTSGAHVEVCYAAAIADGNAGDFATPGVPSGWGNFNSLKVTAGSQRDMIMCAFEQAWTSGAVDPPSLNPTGSASTHSWCAITVAIKPA
jgi:hypothetical protein